jgi:hypothetical protein
LVGKSIIKQFISSSKFTLENTFFKCFLVGLVLLLFVACKKKTNIDVIVFNYALNEPVPNANVVLIERKLNTFSGDYDCSEIANATTNSEGECAFDEEKLRTGSKYNYYMALSDAYGQFLSYPCGGKTSSFIKPGDSYNVILDAGAFPAYLKVQNLSLLNPSLPGDSLSLRIRNPIYQVPGQPYPFGGGGVVNSYAYHGDYSYPYPNYMLSDILTTNAGKNTVHIRKRKMGVLTTYVDTVKIYPYETKIIEINW